MSQDVGCQGYPNLEELEPITWIKARGRSIFDIRICYPRAVFLIGGGRTSCFLSHLLFTLVNYHLDLSLFSVSLPILSRVQIPFSLDHVRIHRYTALSGPKVLVPIFVCTHACVGFTVMRETIVMFGSEADSYDRSAEQLRVCGGGAGLTLISHRSVLYEVGQQRKCELSGVVCENLYCVITILRQADLQACYT